MSVNYYAITAEGEPDAEGLHIGQHAGGWEFLFRAHPKLGLTTTAAWHAFLARPGVRIVAEHGGELALAEFWPDAIRRPAEAGGPNAMRSRFGYGRHRSGESRDERGCPFAVYEFC